MREQLRPGLQQGWSVKASVSKARGLSIFWKVHFQGDGAHLSVSPHPFHALRWKAVAASGGDG